MKAMFDMALIAQDSRIWDLVALVQKFHGGIAKHSVVATLDTGTFIKSMTGIDVSVLPHGTEGGYAQLARFVNTGNLRMVVFLHDPLLCLGDPGIMEFLRACNAQNIPFANNMTTAEFILYRFLEKEMATYWRCPEARPEHNYIYA
jgi:methylglyoxal synthase